MTESWNIAQLLDATEGRLLCGRTDVQVAGISIDSRTLKAGEAYVAIEGEKFDGHRFLEDVLPQASCLIVSKFDEQLHTDIAVILVDDTTEALGKLAAYHRLRMSCAVIAVTGSCGKTTTKDFIAQLVDEPEHVLKSFGNQNNHIGVPLTLLKLESHHRFAVVEMGTNHPGEIAYLASLVQPDAAVVTNVGPAHLEFLGSLMGVLHEKLSLLDSLHEGGVAFIPGDQLEVCLEAPDYVAEGVSIKKFGMGERCDIRAVELNSEDAQGMRMQLSDVTGMWYVPLAGAHNVENALAAIGVARYFGVPDSIIKERLKQSKVTSLRSEVLESAEVTILNDCYNANPLSCARALEVLSGLKVKRRVAVVGDMLELGAYAPSAHQAIGRLAAKLGIESVVAVGDYAEFVAQGVRELRSDGVNTFGTIEGLIEQLPQVFQSGDGVLVKGSRSLRLEQLTESLLAHYPKDNAIAN